MPPARPPGSSSAPRHIQPAATETATKAAIRAAPQGERITRASIPWRADGRRQQRGGERDSNPRPPGPQPGALPTELPPPRRGQDSGVRRAGTGGILDAHGPVAQWTERQASNLRAEVQFLPGPPAARASSLSSSSPPRLDVLPLVIGANAAWRWKSWTARAGPAVRSGAVGRRDPVLAARASMLAASRAGVAELADAPGLGPGGPRPLEVRLLSPAPAGHPPCAREDSNLRPTD